MSEAIESILRKAELQKIQIEMSILFNKNMMLFQQRFPAIFNALNQRSPKRVKLNVDSNNYLNLFDTQLNAYFYTAPPKKYASNQIIDFIRNGKAERLRISHSKIHNPDHIHVAYSNKMVDTFESLPCTKLVNNRKTFYSLILSGVGMGYQLPILIDTCKIYHIFIYEPCLDTFHASLHCIDWQPILDYFSEANRSITFCIGVKPDQALARIEKSVNDLGIHNFVYSFIFQHTKRKEETDFIRDYKSNIANYIGALGFFDDERIGLSHGLQNVKNKTPIFLEKNTTPIHTPLFIVGNGPSLDKHAEFLKKNQSSCIIMSCGTSLASLYKMGIKPHLHIEMERSKTMKDFIDYGTSEDFRKDIILLCLHTISPATISLFNTSCMATKPNDACTHILQALLSPHKLAELAYCNPTVSNCGLSFAIAMGFRKVHLIGVDFGITDSGQHHAKTSTHYELEKRTEDKENFKYNYKDNRNIVIEGNFGGQVKSHNVLNMARVSMERFLKIINHALPDFEAINSNFGAKIAGTTSIKPDQLTTYPKQDINVLIKEIKNNFFFSTKKYGKKIQRTEKILKYFFSIEDVLKLPTDIDNEETLHAAMQDIYNTISSQNDKTTHMLLRGSINTLFGSISENCLYLKSEDEFLQRVHAGIELYNAFIDNAYAIMKQCPLELDETRSELFKGLTYGKS